MSRFVTISRSIVRVNCPRVALRRLSNSVEADAITYPGLELRGSCECGKVGFVARGPSALNFYSHSTAPRMASGEPFLTASGFKPNQVVWTGDVVDSVQQPSYMPPNSSNPHYFCSCAKKQYMGVDATRLLGIVALNLRRTEGYANGTLPDIYRPNHHFFYADRKMDCVDDLPKWKTVLEGDMLPERCEKGELPLACPDDLRLTSHAADEGDRGCHRPSEWTRSAACGAGRLRKDVLPLSPVRPPEPSIYHFTESEHPANNHTIISEEKLRERVQRKYHRSETSSPVSQSADRKRGAIVIGGGHNGLVSAAYLAKSGMDVLVLERRHLVGGAAVTEEIIPGFKFSRASYLAGLLRPQIIEDLQLQRFGFKYLPRNPSSFTPTLINSPYRGKYLILGEDAQENFNSIAQFSVHDAHAFPLYEEFLGE